MAACPVVWSDLRCVGVVKASGVAQIADDKVGLPSRRHLPGEGGCVLRASWSVVVVVPMSIHRASWRRCIRYYPTPLCISWDNERHGVAGCRC